MKNPPASPRVANKYAAPGALPRQLELLLAYEDKSTALRAKRAVDRVLSQPDLNANPKLHIWRLDTLGDEHQRQHAARAAATSDILVVSIHGKKRLANHARESLNAWVGSERNTPCALVISLDSDAKQLADQHLDLVELRTAATRNGITVMHHFG